MLATCHHWDVGKDFPPETQLAERLAKLAHTEAILVLSKTSFPSLWSQGDFCNLVSGPSRFLRVYFEGPPAARSLDPARLQSASWLKEFGELRRLALGGAPWRERAGRLRSEILRQLAWEEAQIFPEVARFLQNERATREMFYEHEGIRRFLPRLEESLAPEAEPRAWERFSLDLVHLLEHHIEHEEDGLYPLFERLLKEGMGVY